MAEKKNIFKRIGQRFKEVRLELKKVIWPTFSQTVNNTKIVIATIIIVAVFLAVCDAVFGTLIMGVVGGDFKQAFMQVLGLAG